MSTALAIFVKTPGLSPLKTRLAKGIGEEKALEFYHLSLKSIIKTVTSSNVTAYWAVAEKEALSNTLWQDFKTLHTGEGDLGQRQHHIYQTLLKEHEHVLLIGADAPQLSSDIINQAMIMLEKNDFILGPAVDGGYYLFGGKKPVEPGIWQKVPWSHAQTRKTLDALLPSPSIHLEPLTDVDIKENLHAVIDEMPNNMNKEQVALTTWINAIL